MKVLVAAVTFAVTSCGTQAASKPENSARSHVRAAESGVRPESLDSLCDDIRRRELDDRHYLAPSTLVTAGEAMQALGDRFPWKMDSSEMLGFCRFYVPDDTSGVPGTSDEAAFLIDGEGRYLPVSPGFPGGS